MLNSLFTGRDGCHLLARTTWGTDVSIVSTAYMVSPLFLDQVSGEGRFAGVTSYKIRSDKSRAAVAAAPRVAKLQPKKGQPAPVDWSKVPPVIKARMQKHMEGMGGYEVRTRSDILQPPARLYPQNILTIGQCIRRS